VIFHDSGDSNYGKVIGNWVQTLASKAPINKGHNELFTMCKQYQLVYKMEDILTHDLAR
jgi:hypothetical protein